MKPLQLQLAVPVRQLVLIGGGEFSPDDKDGVPRNMWQRLKSKIEHIAEKPAEPRRAEEREGGGKG